MSAPDWETRRAVILGCAGTELNSDERALFREIRPAGFILFARNCDNPEQVSSLVSSLRECAGDAALPVLIDQEGGRVARLGPPHWGKYPAAAKFGEIAVQDGQAATRAAYLNARLIARELMAHGIDVDCTPVLDISRDETHAIIGDRSYGADAGAVAILARGVANGLLAEGVISVIKHIPGHGRATADSHEELPVVDAKADTLRATDFRPFSELSRVPWGMTAHILYKGLDAECAATLSKTVIDEIIRAEIGFDGVLLSDDIGMKALGGSFAERASGALDAGCDLVLHCSGDMAEMSGFVQDVRNITTETAVRLDMSFRIREEARRAAPAIDKSVMEAEIVGIFADAGVSP